MKSEFATFLYYMREASGLTSLQLGRIMGCSKTTILRYEKGIHEPKNTDEFISKLRIVVIEEIRRKREKRQGI